MKLLNWSSKRGNQKTLTRKTERGKRRVGRKRIFRTLYYLQAALWLYACGTTPAVDGSPPLVPPRVKTAERAAPTPTPALDECLFGEWRVVDESFARFLTSAVMEGQAAEHQLLEGTGFLWMEFDESGSFRMMAQDYRLTFLVTPATAAMQETQLQIDLPADSSGKYFKAGSAVVAYASDHEGGLPVPFPIRIHEMGVTTAPLHVTPGWFFDGIWAWEDGRAITISGTEARFTNYSCTSEQLSLEAGAYGPVAFTRWEENTE